MATSCSSGHRRLIRRTLPSRHAKRDDKFTFIKPGAGLLILQVPGSAAVLAEINFDQGHPPVVTAAYSSASLLQKCLINLQPGEHQFHASNRLRPFKSSPRNKLPHLTIRYYSGNSTWQVKVFPENPQGEFAFPTLITFRYVELKRVTAFEQIKVKQEGPRALAQKEILTAGARVLYLIQE